MNKLDRERQCQVIAALVEGNSIRSIERMTGIHRDTIAVGGQRRGWLRPIDGQNDARSDMRTPPTR
jgi:transposase